ncbi:MAG: type IX secretion system PorP/SprF family membrane protein [Arenicella sp.]|jgi:type IX secretion system PorP/SprF family membrane protein
MKSTFNIFKLSLALTVVMTSIASVKAQDIHFSQFYMMPLQQNPSMAGAIHPVEANIVFKDQWKAVASPYRTFAMGYHMRFNKNKNTNGYLAAGLNFFSDKAGDANLGTGNGALSIAYHIKADENNTFGAGISAGYMQRKIDFSNLTWASQYDGQTLNSSLQAGAYGTSSFTNFDLGAGANWTYNNSGGDIKVTGNNDLNFNIGLGVFHLNRPDYSFLGSTENQPMRIVAHGTGVISIPDSKWAFVPGFMYARQGPAQEIFVGTLMRYLLSQNSKFTGLKNGAALYAGAYFRTKDAIAAKMIIEYAGWAFGVGYDINVSSLQTVSKFRGGLELSLRFVAPNPFQSNYGGNNSRY